MDHRNHFCNQANWFFKHNTSHDKGPGEEGNRRAARSPLCKTPVVKMTDITSRISWPAPLYDCKSSKMPSASFNTTFT
ncbi:hypothetical protein I79_025776 [Cricetulus griseus]|uniref:Uncharacterized protein n=1 Tax=Cricetulus griseus TaxID=10029 RepID=G3IP72_CRIGR|nr:hypothetical protein I79_025776 [Cricetulus griseus]